MSNQENKYYVYLHRDLNGVVFYVGSGTDRRLTSKINRSKDWQDKASAGFHAEKVCIDLSIEQAREMEALLIQMFPEGELVNKHLPMQTLDLTPEILSQFRYSSESPSGLVWAVDQPIGRNTHKIGDFAGTKESRNERPHRWRVKPANAKSSFAVHRIVWALHHPVNNDKLIDHIDGNSWNNRIENLREVTHAINSRNMKKNKTNKSGVTGVCFKKNKDGNTYWIATWRDASSKSRMKAFMIGCYGNDEAFRLACEYRKKVVDELNSMGFDYSKRSES